MGEILLNNNLTLTQDNWFGDYFKDVLISVKAIPKFGYKFSHWSGDVISNDDEILVNPDTDKQLTANFVKSDLLPLVINEINYKSSEDFDSGDWIEIYNPITFLFLLRHLLKRRIRPIWINVPICCPL